MKGALIIDDHPVTHIGCGQLLRDLGYGEVFEAMTDREAYRLAEAHRPGLIVLDLGMPGPGGLKMIGPLLARAPLAQILVFTMNEQPVFAAKALEAGARGYLSKNSAPEEFEAAVRTLERGEIHLSHGLAVALAAMRVGGAADPLASLTWREHQVLRLLGRARIFSPSPMRCASATRRRRTQARSSSASWASQTRANSSGCRSRWASSDA